MSGGAVVEHIRGASRTIASHQAATLSVGGCQFQRSVALVDLVGESKS